MHNSMAGQTAQHIKNDDSVLDFLFVNELVAMVNQPKHALQAGPMSSDRLLMIKLVAINSTELEVKFKVQIIMGFPSFTYLKQYNANKDAVSQLLWETELGEYASNISK